MEKDFAVIRSQQLPSGLSIAGAGDYDKLWIRDNVYVALAFVAAGHLTDAAAIYEGLFTIIKRYETILDGTTYPEQGSELLHPRFTVEGETVPGYWSNKQHDAVGALLFGTGQLHAIDESYVTASMKELCQKLVNYLERCRYWEDTDNGMWEEDPPVLHASSLGACIRGIEMVSSFCKYDKQAHEKAKTTLEELLPRESELHPEDMAQLSLVWPYGYKLDDVVAAVEKRLLKDKGVIRFVGDLYESNDGNEPQWVLGIPWLGIAHHELGNLDQAAEYLKQTEDLYTDHGLPESYIAENEACVHTPLAWSHAMTIVLRSKLATS